MDRRPLLVAAAALATLLSGVLAAGLPARDVMATERQAAAPARAFMATLGGTTSVPTADPGRPYVLHVPDGLLAPAPLVIALHAHSQKPAAIREVSRLERLADEQGFVVAFPTGGDGSWNAGACCYPGSEKQTDDVAHLDEVLASITGRVGIDPDRIAVVGGSNGAMMALRYACARPEVVASVVMVSGTYVSPCAPTAPLSVLALHGAEDEMVPLAGGLNPALRTSFPAVSDALEPFRRAGGDVQLTVVPGGGHNWMTGDADGLDATHALWDFVRDHPRLG
ncbi:MAG: Poly(3-hydroxybutyrate) depolymerase-like protein [Frankiales bacterium]|nr:Poly(3-hydroxybutyrate) depolymerase-like protein [Frankiales bacterium]